MEKAQLLSLTVVLLTSLSIFLSGETFATVSMPNMTSTEAQSSSLSTERATTQGTARPVEKLAMSAQFMPHESEGLAEPGWFQLTAFGLKSKS
jgi:hypothetical protein